MDIDLQNQNKERKREREEEKKRTFAIVTMSGTTPWVSNPQKWLPVRPNPA
jgi:hypothetical protein